jgi:hypothetical protein
VGHWLRPKTPGCCHTRFLYQNQVPIVCVDVESFAVVTRTRPRVPETKPRVSVPGAGGLTVVDSSWRFGHALCSLTVSSYWCTKSHQFALDHSSGRDPVGRSSPKGCPRSARPPRTSQAIVGMKRGQNWRLKERTRAKEIKNVTTLIKLF